MPVQVTSSAIYTCDHCNQTMTDGLVLIGGIMKVTDGAPEKPSGKAIAICSKDCAIALSDVEFV